MKGDRQTRRKADIISRMSNTLTATVSEDRRLVLDVPGLQPGQRVRVVASPVAEDAGAGGAAKRIDEIGLDAWFRSLPASTRTREEWDEYDRWLRAGRDAF
jgi:hypothetical protein